MQGGHDEQPFLFFVPSMSGYMPTPPTMYSSADPNYFDIVNDSPDAVDSTIVTFTSLFSDVDLHEGPENQFTAICDASASFIVRDTLSSSRQDIAAIAPFTPPPSPTFLPSDDALTAYVQKLIAQYDNLNNCLTSDDSVQKLARHQQRLVDAYNHEICAQTSSSNCLYPVAAERHNLPTARNADKASEEMKRLLLGVKSCAVVNVVNAHMTHVSRKRGAEDADFTFVRKRLRAKPLDGDSREAVASITKMNNTRTPQARFATHHPAYVDVCATIPCVTTKSSRRQRWKIDDTSEELLGGLSRAAPTGVNATLDHSIIAGALVAEMCDTVVAKLADTRSDWAFEVLEAAEHAEQNDRENLYTKKTVDMLKSAPRFRVYDDVQDFRINSLINCIRNDVELADNEFAIALETLMFLYDSPPVPLTLDELDSVMNGYCDTYVNSKSLIDVNSAHIRVL